MNDQLTFGNIVKSSIAIGSKNAVPLMGAVLLWLLTFWIPYINVGTTIGLLGIVAKMGRGGSISPTEIFDPKYRKQMGEFFLVMIFVTTGVSIGISFLVIPGIVISLAWMLAPLLVLDQGLNPMDAVKRSNDLMEGHKWPVFFAPFAVNFGGGFFALTFLAIAGFLDIELLTLLAILVVLVVYLVIIAANLGVTAHVYAVLVPDVPAAAAAPTAPTAE